MTLGKLNRRIGYLQFSQFKERDFAIVFILAYSSCITCNRQNSFMKSVQSACMTMNQQGKKSYRLPLSADPTEHRIKTGSLSIGNRRTER